MRYVSAGGCTAENPIAVFLSFLLNLTENVAILQSARKKGMDVVNVRRIFCASETTTLFPEMITFSCAKNGTFLDIVVSPLDVVEYFAVENKAAAKKKAIKGTLANGTYGGGIF